MDYKIRRMPPDELRHYGITGQKWGIRRYQNPDGTLTEAGKAKIAKTAGWGYLNPPNKKSKNRDEIGKEYSKEFWGKIADHKMPLNSPSQEGRKLWDKYKEKYASATLKDLKMKNTTQARRDVKRILAQIDADYKYRDMNDYSDERTKTFESRRKELEHPKKTKATKTVVKVGKATKAIAETAKIFV